MKEIAKRVLILRKEQKKTQEEVAAATGLSFNGYRKIERGESDPTLPSLVKLADYFDVSVDYLIGRSESRK